MTDSGERPHPIGDALNEHHAYLRGLARKLIGDAHGADDLVQETARRALESPPRHAGNLRAWLGTVARRLAMRTGAREGAREQRETRARGAQPLPSPDELAAQAETQRKLAEAVGRLDEPYRSTIMLRFFEGLETSEIAARADLPPKTVHTRIRRGLERLRGILDADHPGGRREWTLALLPIACGRDAIEAARAAIAAGSTTATTTSWIAPTATAAALGLASFGVGWATTPITVREPAPVGAVGSAGTQQQPSDAAETDKRDPVTASADAAPSGFLQRIEQAATWKDAREIGREIADLAPDEGLEVVRRVFGEISSWRYRKHLLDAFAWWGVHHHAAEIFELGSRDPHFLVRQRALELAAEYLAFRDFSQSPESFREWYAGVEGLTLPQLIERSVLLCADRLRAVDGELREIELKAFADGNLMVESLWEGTGVNVRRIVRDAGLESSLRTWAFDAGQSIGVRATAMWLISRLDRDPAFLASRFLPILDRPAAQDPRLVTAAFSALRKADCGWALERLREVYPRLADQQSRRAWAWTVARAGGDAALPDLIALRLREGDDSPVREALAELAGVLFDQRPTGEWWEHWWETRGRSK